MSPQYTLSDPDVMTILRKIYELGKKYPDTRTNSLPAVLAGEPPEIKARYLYVNAVLDQGSDMIGTSHFLRDTTEGLYRMGFHIFHDPLQFWKDPGKVRSVLETVHENVKGARAAWAKEYLTNSATYNLMLAAGQRGTQITPHIALSWGAPLLIIQALIDKKETLLGKLSSLGSVEQCVGFLKDDRDLGLGKAIGDKACHLLMKWLVDTYGFLPLPGTRSAQSWTKNSYHLPFDSNAIRVLTMTGVVTHFIGEQELTGPTNVFQPKEKGKVYIRATNLREREILRDHPLQGCIEQTMAKRFSPRLRKRAFPYVLNAAVEVIDPKDPRMAVLDDGLMYIGTTRCKNKDPQCGACELKDLCHANTQEPEWKEKYYT